VTVEEEMILEVQVHTVAIVIEKKHRLESRAVVKKEPAAVVAVNHLQSQERLIIKKQKHGRFRSCFF
jgi:hypothetical protein